MPRTVTIVMYHYVRPLRVSGYPAIKGLDVSLFREQVEYMRKHYNVVSLDDVIAAWAGVLSGDDFPPNAAVLSFDDGYLDHYRYVLPVLHDAKLSGAFFAPSGVVCDRRVLDVNKIHFVLAAVEDAGQVAAELDELLTTLHPTLDRAELRRSYCVPSRFDPAEVIYVKRLLQHALPRAVRTDIVDRLFRKFVTSDEAAFAEELYLTAEQLRIMAQLGMHVGSHGDNHDWLDRMSREEQAKDIERSLRLFDAIGAPREGFTFCAPFGAYNADTLAVLRGYGCRAAVTTKVELARPGCSLLELPRLDTNDLPKDANSPPSTWTLAMREAAA